MPHKRIKKALSKVKKGTKRALKKVPRAKVVQKMRPVARVAPRAISPWWGLVPTATNIWHYGTHPEVLEWWRQRGEDVGSAIEELQFETGLGSTESIDPDSPWFIPPGYGNGEGLAPMMPEQAPPESKPRKVSKANKATSKAWKLLTARVKGKLTQEKCRKLLKKCATMASKANPNTKSRIGKGTSQMCKDCRKIRKQIWGTTKRY